MKKNINFIIFLLSVTLALLMTGCNSVDMLYGTESENESLRQVANSSDNESERRIMSSDRIMSKYFDISLFDEENYSDVYLGSKFEFNVKIDSDSFNVPTKLSKLEKKDWSLVKNTQYNEDSLVYAGETIDVALENKDGVSVEATFYNPTNSSRKLDKCNIVKFKILNNYYTNPEGYAKFNINGINNNMAITDIIEVLGTPSHFYGLSENNYYLDYFVSEGDRRNGITVYINPTDDSITAVEFSYYK